MPDTTTLTENDKITAAEEAFVQTMVAKAEPKAEKKDAPKTEAKVEAKPETPAKEEAATETAVTAAEGDGVEGKRLGVTEPPAATEEKEGDETTDETAEVEITDDAFAAAMAAERAPISLDALPEAARPVVQKKLKDLEGGFTRAMQRLAGQRKEAEAVLAERAFQEARPADYIVTMLMAHPDLMDQVNGRLDEFEKSPTSKEAHAVIVKQARADAVKALDDKRAKEEADAKRGQEFITRGKAAAKVAGVPFEMGVEADIAAHLAIHGDITDDEIKSIAIAKAKIWRGALNEQQRDKAGKYVAAKVADRRTAGLAVRPQTGVSAPPTKAAPPKNDDEFIAHMVERLST